MTGLSKMVHKAHRSVGVESCFDRRELHVGFLRLQLTISMIRLRHQWIQLGRSCLTFPPVTAPSGRLASSRQRRFLFNGFRDSGTKIVKRLFYRGLKLLGEAVSHPSNLRVHSSNHRAASGSFSGPNTTNARRAMMMSSPPCKLNTPISLRA